VEKINLFIKTVIIQMKSQKSFADKENKHPNQRVTEADISTIAKTYVFDGQRVKAKSILYRDAHPSPPKTEIPPQKQPTPTPEDFHKLEYLEKLGVLTKEEQAILQQMRKMSHFGTQRTRAPLSKLTPKFPAMMAPQKSFPLSQSHLSANSYAQNMDGIQYFGKECLGEDEGYYESLEDYEGYKEQEEYGMYPNY